MGWWCVRVCVQGGCLEFGVPEFSFERNEIVNELIKEEERRRMSAEKRSRATVCWRRSGGT